MKNYDRKTILKFINTLAISFILLMFVYYLRNRRIESLLNQRLNSQIPSTTHMPNGYIAIEWYVIALLLCTFLLRICYEMGKNYVKLIRNKQVILSYLSVGLAFAFTFFWHNWVLIAVSHKYGDAIKVFMGSSVWFITTIIVLAVAIGGFVWGSKTETAKF